MYLDFFLVLSPKTIDSLHQHKMKIFKKCKLPDNSTGKLWKNWDKKKTSDEFCIYVYSD